MDPDANLNEQLEIAHRALRIGMSFDDIKRLPELIIAMDEWLHKDGALPARWRRSKSNG